MLTYPRTKTPSKVLILDQVRRNQLKVELSNGQGQPYGFECLNS